jgi:chromosome segregation ATPase
MIHVYGIKPSNLIVAVVSLSVIMSSSLLAYTWYATSRAGALNEYLSNELATLSDDFMNATSTIDALEKALNETTTVWELGKNEIYASNVWEEHLRWEYRRLDDLYEQLLERYDALNSTHQELLVDYEELAASYNELWETYNLTMSP